MSKLPALHELTATQAILEVASYDEYNDAFNCTMHTSAPCDGTPCVIPALMLPMLVHEYGEPDEFVRRLFLIERGAKKSDYTRLQGVLVTVAEDFQEVLHGGRADRNAELVYKTADEANRVAAQL